MLAEGVGAFALDGERALRTLGRESIEPVGAAVGLTVGPLHHGHVVLVKVAPTDGAGQMVLQHAHRRNAPHGGVRVLTFRRKPTAAGATFKTRARWKARRKRQTLCQCMPNATSSLSATGWPQAPQGGATAPPRPMALMPRVSPPVQEAHHHHNNRQSVTMVKMWCQDYHALGAWGQWWWCVEAHQERQSRRRPERQQPRKWLGQRPGTGAG